MARSTVVAVIPWDSVRERLSPQFELSASDAIDLVGPVTRDVSSSTLRTFGGSLGISASASLGGATTETPGQTLPAAMPQIPSDGALATLTPAARYQLAGSLVQHVQLLNEAASNLVASNRALYVVVVDVALLVRAREELSADVYLTFDRKIDETGDGGIRVFPIATQDDLELSRGNQARESARALSLLLHVVGSIQKAQVEGSGLVSSLVRSLERSSSTDIETTFFVAPETDETLLVHFNPRPLGTSEQDYRLTTQTRRLWAIIALPDEATVPLDLYTSVEFRRGKEALPLGPNPIQHRVDAIMSDPSRRVPWLLRRSCAKKLEADFRKSPDDGFDAITVPTAKSCGWKGDWRNGVVQSEFSRMVQATEGVHLSMSRSTVPLPEQATSDADAGVSSLLATRGDSSLMVAVPGNRLSEDRARWMLEVCSAKPPPRTAPCARDSSCVCALPDQAKRAQASLSEVTFPAESVDSVSRHSPAGQKAEDDEGGSESVKLLWYKGGAGQEAKWSPVAPLTVSPPRVDSQPILTLLSTPIVAEPDGKGAAVVEIANGQGVAAIAVQGSATLVTGPGATATELPVRTKAAAEVTRQAVQFEHLMAGTTLRLLSLGKKGRPIGHPVEVMVVARQPPK